MSDLYIGGYRFGGESLVGGLVLSSLTGWYDTPDDKTDYQERATSYGDFPVSSIRRGARVLDLDLGFEFPSRADATAMFHRLNALHGSQQVVRLVDEMDMFCTGTVTFGFPKMKGVAGALSGTVTCTDPRIYSSDLQEINLTSQASSSGSVGVSYGDGLTYGDGFTYGASGLLETNSGTLRNGGNSPAYPTFEIHGGFPSGVRVTSSAGDVLEWASPIYSSAPVTLDCFNRRGLIMGVDQSTNLSRREFFSVPPGGQLGVTFMPLEASSGFCTARVRDTYI
jgi:hypothetical protein